MEESIESFDDNWLTVLEQEGLSSYFPVDYVKTNSKNVKSWLEFIIPEEPEKRKKIKYRCKYCKTDFHNTQISMRYAGPMSEGGRVIEDKSKHFNSKVVYEHPDTVTHRNDIAHKVKAEGAIFQHNIGSGITLVRDFLVSNEFFWLFHISFVNHLKR